jgi:hypothetical protein
LSSQEVALEFPTDKDTVITNLICKIGDDEIKGKVKNKEQAKEDYNSAVAKNQTAVFAERDSTASPSLTLTLGHLPA